MKQVLKYLPILVIITACGTTNDTSITHHDTTTKAAQIVGNDADAHDCKGSAGYQWSEVKHTCIRVFEDGIRLNPKVDTASATLSAFVVFKSQEIQDTAELFLPNDSSQLLVQDKTNGAGKWGNTKYELTQWKGMYTLERINSKTVLYQGVSTK